MVRHAMMLAMMAFCGSAMAQVLPVDCNDPDLVAYWSFDSNLNDCSENANDARPVGSVPLASGRFGNAADVSAAGSYLEVPTTDDFRFDSLTPVTCSIWAAIPANVNRYNAFICVGVEAQQNYIMVGKVRSGDSNGAAYCDAFAQDFDPVDRGLVQSIASGSELSDNEWRHYAAVFDPFAQEVRFYIDGVVQGIDTQYQQFDFSQADSILVRLADYSVVSSVTQDFRGRLDEAAVWTRALSEEEIFDLANPLLGDLNSDCSVDLADLAVLLADFGCQSDCDGDTDGDGDADLSDLAEILGNFGQGC